MNIDNVLKDHGTYLNTSSNKFTMFNDVEQIGYSYLDIPLGSNVGEDCSIFYNIGDNNFSNIYLTGIKEVNSIDFMYKSSIIKLEGAYLYTTFASSRNKIALLEYTTKNTTIVRTFDCFTHAQIKSTTLDFPAIAFAINEDYFLAINYSGYYSGIHDKHGKIILYDYNLNEQWVADAHLYCEDKRKTQSHGILNNYFFILNDSTIYRINLLTGENDYFSKEQYSTFHIASNKIFANEIGKYIHVLDSNFNIERRHPSKGDYIGENKDYYVYAQFDDNVIYANPYKKSTNDYVPGRFIGSYPSLVNPRIQHETINNCVYTDGYVLKTILKKKGAMYKCL